MLRLVYGDPCTSHKMPAKAEEEGAFPDADRLPCKKGQD